MTQKLVIEGFSGESDAYRTNDNDRLVTKYEYFSKRESSK